MVRLCGGGLILLVLPGTRRRLSQSALCDHFYLFACVRLQLVPSDCEKVFTVSLLYAATVKSKHVSGARSFFFFFLGFEVERLVGQKCPTNLREQFPLHHNEVGRERAAGHLATVWQLGAAATAQGPFLLPLEPTLDSRRAPTPRFLSHAAGIQSHLCGNLAVPCEEIDRRTSENKSRATQRSKVAVPNREEVVKRLAGRAFISSFTSMLQNVLWAKRK